MVKGVVIDKFGPKYFRAWDRDRHVHHSCGEASCSAEATTEADAIEKLAVLVWRSRPGLSCVEGVCPQYVHDIW